VVVNYGACQTRCKAYAQRGEKVFVKSGNCHIEHTAIFCLCYAVVFLVFDQLCVSSLNFVRRCLSHDSDVVKFISDYCIKYIHCSSRIGKNVM